jgi:hypothetical protein
VTDRKDPKDDAEAVTPIRVTTGAYPMLRQIAVERAEELDKIPGAEAKEQADAFRAIAAILKSWSPTNRPTDEDRLKLQDELFARNKIASTLIERHRIAMEAGHSEPPPWKPPRRSRPPKKR